MTLPKSLTTVTTFSKTIALFLFILLPFAGFYAGYKYRAGTYVNTPIVQNNPGVIPTPTIDITNWKTYSDGRISFKYPPTWGQKPIQLVGSGSLVKIDDPQGVFVLSFIQRGNYNNGTGKPFVDLYEYIDIHQAAELNVGGQLAVEPLPRAGSEDIYLVDFFSKDNKLIYSIDLEPKNRTSDHVRPENEEKIFNQILTTFKFSNQNQTGCNIDNDCQNGEKCMEGGPVIRNQPAHKFCVQKGQVVPL